MEETNKISSGFGIVSVRFLISLLAGFAMMLLFQLIFSILLVTKDYPHSLIPAFSGVCVGAGAICCGFLVAFWNQKRGWLMGLCGGLLLSGVLIAIGLLIDGSALGSAAWSKLILCSCCGMIGGILGIRLRFHRKAE